jgi:type II secretory pathway component GspD/PulD (secretin)
MKSKLRVVISLAWVLIIALAFGQTQRSFRVNFSKTNVDEVLQALSQQTGANIVYNGKGDIPITVNFLATSTEDAVRGAAAAAGLTYRRINNTYVVAAPENLRRAVMPYGNRVKFSLTNLKPDEAAKLVEASFPTVTAEAAGDKLAVTAIPADIVMVREFLDEKEAFAAKNSQTRIIIQVKNASATVLGQTIKNLYPSLTVEAVGKADSTAGSIVLSGPKADVDVASKMIAAIDNGNNIAGEEEVVRLYEIKYSSAPELVKVLKEVANEVQVTVGPATYSPRTPGFNPIAGSKVGTSTMGSGSGGGIQAVPETQNGVDAPKEGDRSKSIILRGRRGAVESAMELLNQIDVRPRQVMVEVQVIDTTPELTDKLGVKWDWLPFNFWEAPRKSLIDTDFVNTTRPAGFGQFTRLPFNFNAILDAMVVKKEAKILARPSVMVIDGDESNVFIGDTIRARIAQAGGLGAQTVEIVEFPVGIILLLRPRVNADGNITMRVHPVVSTITAIDDDNIPQTSTREAETTVMVKDGETVIIGGLIRDEMSRTIQEVPILSKLPIIGELFRNRSTSKRKSEIMVLITPHLVKDNDRRPGN